MDNNVLQQPEAAIRLATMEMTRITEYVSDMAEKAKQAFLHEDKNAMKQVDQLEDIVDILQEKGRA